VAAAAAAVGGAGVAASAAAAAVAAAPPPPRSPFPPLPLPYAGAKKKPAPTPLRGIPGGVCALGVPCCEPTDVCMQQLLFMKCAGKTRGAAVTTVAQHAARKAARAAAVDGIGGDADYGSGSTVVDAPTDDDEAVASAGAAAVSSEDASEAPQPVDKGVLFRALRANAREWPNILLGSVSAWASSLG